MTLLWLTTFSQLTAVQAGRPDASVREFFPSRHSPSIARSRLGSGPGDRRLPPGPAGRHVTSSSSGGAQRTGERAPTDAFLCSTWNVARGEWPGAPSSQVPDRARAVSAPGRLPSGLSLYRVVKTHYGVDRIVYVSNRLFVRPTQGEPADVQLVWAAAPVTLSTAVMSASARNGEARESATFRSGSSRSCRFHGCDAMPARTLALGEISHVLDCMKAGILPVSQKSVRLRADGTPSVCVPRGTPKPAACTADRHVASGPTLRPMEAASPPVIAAAARRPKADTVDVTRLIAATP